MTNTKEVILNLKKVKEEKGYSLDTILEMIEENGEFVSKSTLSRVFRDGSEDQSFNYDGTLSPIANALLDDDNADTKAFRAILKLKKDLINELKDELKAVETKEKEKYHEKLGKMAAEYQKTMAFYADQIALKDKRIDMLMEDNHILLTQLLTCSCRKGEL